MRALIDTNVLLDVFEKREPFFEDSIEIFYLAVQKKIEGCVSVQSMKDISYLYRKSGGTDPQHPLEVILYIFEVIDMTREDIVSTLNSNVEDLEDGFLAFSALRNGIDAIITRNEEDFVETDMVVINPSEIYKYLGGDIKAGNDTIDNVFIHRRKNAHL
jgi:predicted nucleic acid-binding protein